MNALLQNGVVMELSEDTFPISSSDTITLAWLAILPAHGVVDISMIYVSETDSFMSHKFGDVLYKKLPVDGEYVDSSVPASGVIDDDYTLLERGEYDSWDATNSVWVLDPVKYNPAVAIAREAKKVIFRANAKSEIESTFTSDALGTTHTYDSRKEDQNNLVMAMSEAEISNPQIALVKCSSTGGYSDVSHTLANIKQVMKDCSLHIRPIRDKLEQKKGALDSANTLELVAAVTWE